MSNNCTQVLEAVEGIFAQAQATLAAAGPEERPHWRAVLHAGQALAFSPPHSGGNSSVELLAGPQRVIGNVQQ